MTSQVFSSLLSITSLCNFVCECLGALVSKPIATLGNLFTIDDCLTHRQRNQMIDFLKFSAANFFTKVAQLFVYFKAILKKSLFNEN